MGQTESVSNRYIREYEIEHLLKHNKIMKEIVRVI